MLWGLILLAFVVAAVQYSLGLPLAGGTFLAIGAIAALVAGRIEFRHARKKRKLNPAR
jgi:hypothetical protein